MGKLEQLQELLGVRQNRRALDRLDERVSDRRSRADDVAEVLPDALRAADESGTLSAPLSQPVERAVHESVSRNPKVFADVLFPVMGPAIRRSITEALRSFVEGLNRAMEQRLSPRAIGWRLEAWKTGVPYREVVLSHTLEYRVRLAFLMHRPSGLLIHHAGERRAGDIDEDAFSAMLTAIQDFIRDSIDHADEDSGLSSAELGNNTVWVLSGYGSRLAVVLDGHPPLSARDQLTESLEQIHNQQSLWLKRFDGSQEVPEDLQELVEACVLAEEKPREPARINVGLWIVLAALLGLLGWIGYGIYGQYRDDQIRSTIAAALADQPGIILVGIQSEPSWVVEGLADPLAQPPAEILAPLGLTVEPELRFAPYYAADARIEAQRMRRSLKPPEGVTISADGADRVIFAGAADLDWIQQVNRMIESRVDPSRFDTSGLATDFETMLARIKERLALPETADLVLDNGQLALTGSGPLTLLEEVNEVTAVYSALDLTTEAFRDELEVAREALISGLQGARIQFVDEIEIGEGSIAELDRIAELIRATLTPLSSEFPGKIVLLGLTDATGGDALNQRLRRERAEFVRDELVERGVDSAILEAIPSREQGREDLSWRRVDFRVR